MSRAIDVARYLIHLAAPREDEDIDCLCHLRLQKLLYYVQGWHLAVFDRPLFEGRIEAWKHGPVVREVYPHFRDFGYNSIPPAQGRQPDGMSSTDLEYVRSVWREYGRFSAWALREMTHSEPPWRETRVGLADDAHCDREITPERMRSYFVSQLGTRLVAGIDPASTYRAAESLDRTGGISLDAALAGIRAGL